LRVSFPFRCFPPHQDILLHNARIAIVLVVSRVLVCGVSVLRSLGVTSYVRVHLSTWYDDVRE
jgi:hypothetical protein